MPSLPALLEHTADLLDLLDQEPFKAKAYRNAARSLEEYLAAGGNLSDDLTKLPRIGKGLAAELGHYQATGTLTAYEEAAAQIPPGVLELFLVRGLGPKKIRVLWQAGIDSLELLRGAAQSGKLSQIKGFGAKTSQTILENVEFVQRSQQQLLLSAAQQLSQELAQKLGSGALFVGQVGRGLETVERLALTVNGEPPAILENATDHEHTLGGTYQGVAVTLAGGPAQTRGARDFLVGAPPEFARHWQQVAAERGFLLTEQGLQQDGHFWETPDEAALAVALGLPLPLPEYRETEHLNLWQRLPPATDLISPTQVKGMLHTHSTWSDGTASLRQMVEGALERGHEYLGTGDHSRAAHYANGLSLERLQDYLREIRELQRAGLPILAGVEVDILADGSLDYPDDILAELDYVVASVHSHFTLDAEAQTERLIRAVQHPLITILGHPTGRLLLRRPGYTFDLQRVLQACADNGTVVEINANPHRLDLDWREALRWRERLTFAINTDAHAPAGLDDLGYGVKVARKAGLTPQQVINTLSREDFLAFVGRQRQARNR